MKFLYQQNNDIDLILEKSDLQKFEHGSLEEKIDELNKRIKLDYNIAIRNRVITKDKNFIHATITGEDYNGVCLEKKPLFFRYDGEHKMSISYRD